MRGLLTSDLTVVEEPGTVAGSWRARVQPVPAVWCVNVVENRVPVVDAVRVARIRRVRGSGRNLDIVGAGRFWRRPAGLWSDSVQRARALRSWSVS